MMAPKNYGKCAGCRNIIQYNEFLACCKCKLKYDIECANISPSRYRTFFALDQNRKNNWICPECSSNAKKTDNTDMPVQRVPSEIGKEDASEDESIVLQSDIVPIKSTKILHGPAASNTDSVSPVLSSGKGHITEDKFRAIIKMELASMQTNIMCAVTDKLNNIVTQFGEIRESMSFFNKQYEDLKLDLDTKTMIIQELKNDNEKLKSVVQDLSSRVNSVEQNMRSCNVELNGIPENKSENLNDTFNQLVKVLGVPIAADDVVQVTRVAKITNDSERPRAIIAKLRTPRHRDSMLAAVANFNKKNPQDKLSSKHLGQAGSRKPIFVAEHLSPSNKSLHAAARHKAKELNFKFIWVRNGRIFIRKTEYSESILIRNMDSLNLIK